MTPRRPVRAFLGLGSNLGDRRTYLRAAVDRLPDLVAVSRAFIAVTMSARICS